MPKGARQLSTLVWGHLTPSCENDSSGDVSSVKLAQANIIKAAVFARAITHSENMASATSFRRTRWMQKNQKKAVKPRLPTLLLTSSHGLQKPKHRPGITPPPWMLIDCYGGKKASDLKTKLETKELPSACGMPSCWAAMTSVCRHGDGERRSPTKRPPTPLHGIWCKFTTNSSICEAGRTCHGGGPSSKTQQWEIPARSCGQDKRPTKVLHVV